MQIATPYLMFLGDVPDPLAAKTAHGIVDWRREWCVGQMRLPGCEADLGLPDMTIAEAAGAGREDPGRRRRQRRRRAARALGRRDRRGARRRHGRRERPARPARRRSRHRRGRANATAAQLHDVRHSDRALRHRQGHEAAGPAPAHRRHRLLGRQEIHGARARAGDARARLRRRFPRHRPDRRAYRRPRRRDRRGGGRLHLRRRRMALARGRPGRTGTSSRARARCSTPPSPASRWACCTAPSRTPSWSATSRPARTMRGVAAPAAVDPQVIDLTVALRPLTNPAIRPVGIAINTAGARRGRGAAPTRGARPRARPAGDRPGPLRRRADRRPDRRPSSAGRVQRRASMDAGASPSPSSACRSPAPSRSRAAAATEAVVVVAGSRRTGSVGRGECVPYAALRRDAWRASPRSIRDQAARSRRARPAPTAGRHAAPGAARNALDCALWDLEAKRRGRAGLGVAGLAGAAARRHRLHAQPRHAGAMEAAARAGRAPAAAQAQARRRRRPRADRGRPRGGAGRAPHRRRQRGLAPGRRSRPTSRACAAAGVALIEQPLPAGDGRAAGARWPGRPGLRRREPATTAPTSTRSSGATTRSTSSSTRPAG